MMIQRWIDQHRNQHGARRRVSLAHAVLRSALPNEARLHELVPSNAAEKVKLPKLLTRAITPFSPDETARFIRAAQRRVTFPGVLFIVTVTCGLRLGEVLGLTWQDVDLDTGKVSINRQLSRSESN